MLPVSASIDARSFSLFLNCIDIECRTLFLLASTCASNKRFIRTSERTVVILDVSGVAYFLLTLSIDSIRL